MPRYLSKAVTLAALFGALSFSSVALAADKVNVQLDWVVRGNHAMFFVGKEKGFFAKNNIEVAEIRKGTGSPDAMRLVGNGNADFGFGDFPTLAVARSQDVPVVALVAVNQHSPLAMISLAKTVKLSKPADLKGLTIGIHPAGSTYIFFKGLLAANGMTEKDMTLNSVSPPYESYLLLGRVQTVVGYVDAEVPELEAKAGGPGSLSIFLGADYGWKAYGSGMFTSQKLISENPDLVRRFVKGYKEAFEYVAAHPEEAAEITAKAAPGYTEKADVLLAQIKADISSTFTSPATKEHGLGWMTKAQWDETLKTLTEQGLLKVSVPADDVFTDKFLTGE